MDAIHDRHAGDLDGRLEPLDKATPATVVISIPPEVASLPACQHTAWMLLNLLARSARIVQRVGVTCPDGVPLAGRVVPLAARNLDLATALQVGANAIGGVPARVSAQAPERDGMIHLIVGPGPAFPNGIRVHGEQWWGGFSTTAIDADGTSDLPFGPYVAACLACSEVFKAIRLVHYEPLRSAFYSVWSFTASSTPLSEDDWVGPPTLSGVDIDATLAGVGAVGSTWVHVLWATVGIRGTALIADADTAGVDSTNLNRCPIFGREAIGQQKASEAARICEDAAIAWQPHDGAVNGASARPQLLVSAVDTNASREAIQALYPARLLSGSTNDLRAEILRCDPTAGTACIHCYNPVEVSEPSDRERRRQYLAMNDSERRQLAVDLGVSFDEVMSWAVEGTCGYAGDQVAAHLLPSDDGPEAFAVGFVSVMSGVMLAALTLQQFLRDGPILGARCRAVFQFFDPLAVTNAPGYRARETTCTMCAPDAPGTSIWRTRYSSF
jgi:hypothetical protein